MNNEKEYTFEWDKSAKFFDDQGCYSLLSNQLKNYNTIFEVGCGTGYSTLALAKSGFKVISLEKNIYCLNKAKEMIEKNGYCDSVEFIYGDIVDDNLINNIVKNYNFDIVICWNMGTALEKTFGDKYIIHMLNYGLTKEQIKLNIESSYIEMIIYKAFSIAYNKRIPFQIVDRTLIPINKSNGQYYLKLKNEFKYNFIIFNNYEAKALSNGGKELIIEKKVIKEDLISINLASILFLL